MSWEPLTEIEMAVIDAAQAEELVDFLGILDDAGFAERYRAQLRGQPGMSSPVCSSPARPAQSLPSA